MGIILTMPDQMTLVSESSVEMGHASPLSSVMVVSAAELCLFFARIVLSGAIRCLPRLPLIQILWWSALLCGNRLSSMEHCGSFDVSKATI